jgi:hypothetical protein
MNKLDTTLFELPIILDSLTHSSTWAILLDLKDIKEEILNIRIEFSKKFNEHIDDINLIEEQLIYINKNIKTFEEALTYHENKIFKKILYGVNFLELCLN